VSFPPVPGADWFLHSLKLQASTGIDGFVKQDATPVMLTWQVPDDGNMHRVAVFCSEQCVTTETGGSVSAFIIPPNGGAAAEPQFLAASLVGGNHVGSTFGIVGPGVTVTIEQTSALTAGGPTTVWCEIWGS
jgi:hypothetical protein